MNLEAVVEYIQGIKDDKKSGQSLFGDAGEKEFGDFKFEQFPELDREERLKIEKELIGFYFSGHPLDDYKQEWEKFVKLDLSDTDNAAPADYTLIGMLKSLKPYTTKAGKTMAFGSLSDYRGEIDLTFFERTWENCRDRINVGDIFALKGKLDRNKGKTNILVDSILDPIVTKSKKDLLEYCSSQGGSRSAWNSAADLSDLDEYKDAWKQFVNLDLSKPEEASDGDYTLIGVLTRLKPIKTRKDQDMAFASLADYNGQIDLTFFPSAWEFNRDKVIENHCIAVKGKIDQSRDKPSFQVSSVLELGKLRRKASRLAAEAEEALPVKTDTPPETTDSREAQWNELHIRLMEAAAGQEENLYPLRDYLAENPGFCPVYIHVPLPGGETIIRAAAGTNVPAEKLAQTRCVAEVWGN
jgi:DNA polymerase-3 subunit alpha